MVPVLLAVVLSLLDLLLSRLATVLQQNVLRKVVAFLVEGVVAPPLFVELQHA